LLNEDILKDLCDSDSVNPFQEFITLALVDQPSSPNPGVLVWDLLKRRLENDFGVLTHKMIKLHSRYKDFDHGVKAAKKKLSKLRMVETESNKKLIQPWLEKLELYVAGRLEVYSTKLSGIK